MRTFREIAKDEMLQEYKANAMMLIDLAESIDEIENLNESSKLHKVNKTLGKVGLHVHKKSGILDYIKKFSSVYGKVILHFIKGDLEKAKELIKSISKEEFLDFILKLDLGTLHLISGPIHTIDAWTGWDLGVELKKMTMKADDIIDDIKNGISDIKDKLKMAFTGHEADRFIKNAEAIEQGLSL